MPARLLVACLLAAAALRLAAPASVRAEVPQQILSAAGIIYSPPDHPELKLDVYYPPKSGRGLLPVVMYIHGGGWRAGSRSSAQPLLERLAAAGYVVVSIDYRLTPEYRYPAQVEDCTAALEWIHEHASLYGGDSGRIAAAGHSAGGYLAALLGTGRGSVSMVDDSFPVQAVLVWAPPVDFLQEEPATSPASMVEQLLGGRPSKVSDLARKASPLTYIDAQDPPFFISHGTRDTSVPLRQSALLAGALEQVGVPCEYHEVRGGRHTDLFRTGAAMDREVARALAFLARQFPPAAPAP